MVCQYSFECIVPIDKSKTLLGEALFICLRDTLILYYQKIDFYKYRLCFSFEKKMIDRMIDLVL
jgi:hypothetical protein